MTEVKRWYKRINWWVVSLVVVLVLVIVFLSLKGRALAECDMQEFIFNVKKETNVSEERAQDLKDRALELCPEKNGDYNDAISAINSVGVRSATDSGDSPSWSEQFVGLIFAILIVVGGGYALYLMYQKANSYRNGGGANGGGANGGGANGGANGGAKAGANGGVKASPAAAGNAKVNMGGVILNVA